MIPSAETLMRLGKGDHVAQWLRPQRPKWMASLCQVLISAVAQMKLLNRPGRVEPRAVKRRETNSTLLTQPRHLLRAQLQAQREQKMQAIWA